MMLDGVQLVVGVFKKEALVHHPDCKELILLPSLLLLLLLLLLYQIIQEQIRGLKVRGARERMANVRRILQPLNH